LNQYNSVVFLLNFLSSTLNFMISEFTILISFLRISNLIMKRTLFSLQKMTRKWILWLLKIQLLLWKWN